MAGIDIGELEREAGLAKGSIFRVLSGGRGGRTSVELVARVAFALGDVDLGFLITGEFHVRRVPFVLRERRTVSKLPAGTGVPSSPSGIGLEQPLPGQTTFEWLQPQPQVPELPTKTRRKPAPRKKKPPR